jgi:hypothetical protein
MCKIQFCNNVYFLLIFVYIISSYSIHLMCHQTLSTSRNYVITNPKFVMFTPLVVLKDLCLVIGP